MEQIPDWLDPYLPQPVLVARLVLATALGALIGIERETGDHAAGVRTNALVALAAALFTVITYQIFATVQAQGGQTADPIRIVEAVTSGVAFIAAGAIIRGGGRGVRGLTTGAALWLSGALGVACALGQYGLAIFSAALALILLRIVKMLT